MSVEDTFPWMEQILLFNFWRRLDSVKIDEMKQMILVAVAAATE